MGATSVTGTGRGEAGITRGPNNGRNQYYSLVDPHVVFHGTAVLSQGAALVSLPSNVRAAPTHLSIFVAGKGFAITKLVTDDVVTGFVILGYGDVVDFIVIDANNACFCEDYAGGGI